MKPVNNQEKKQTKVSKLEEKITRKQEKLVQKEQNLKEFQARVNQKIQWNQ